MIQTKITRVHHIANNSKPNKIIVRGMISRLMFTSTRWTTTSKLKPVSKWAWIIKRNFKLCRRKIEWRRTTGCPYLSQVNPAQVVQKSRLAQVSYPTIARANLMEVRVMAEEHHSLQGKEVLFLIRSQEERSLVDIPEAMVKRIFASLRSLHTLLQRTTIKAGTRRRLTKSSKIPTILLQIQMEKSKVARIRLLIGKTATSWVNPIVSLIWKRKILRIAVEITLLKITVHR